MDRRRGDGRGAAAFVLVAGRAAVRARPHQGARPALGRRGGDRSDVHRGRDGRGRGARQIDPDWRARRSGHRGRERGRAAPLGRRPTPPRPDRGRSAAASDAERQRARQTPCACEAGARAAEACLRSQGRGAASRPARRHAEPARRHAHHHGRAPLPCPTAERAAIRTSSPRSPPWIARAPPSPGATPPDAFRSSTRTRPRSPAARSRRRPRSCASRRWSGSAGGPRRRRWPARSPTHTRGARTSPRCASSRIRD